MTQVDPAVLDARREDMRAASANRKRAVRTAAAHKQLEPVRALLASGRKSVTPKEIIAAAISMISVPYADLERLDRLDLLHVLAFAARGLGDLELIFQRERLRAEQLAAQLVQLRADCRALEAVAARPVASMTKIHRDAQGEMASTETHYR